MSRWLQRRWYGPRPAPLILRPFSFLYGAVADWRARRDRMRARQLPVPAVVVGNVTAGGTGKTPCVLWLVEALRGMGHRPGILSRGYGGRGPFPLLVGPTTVPDQCGDEPALLAVRAGVPVACAPDRVAAGHMLLAAYPQVDVLVCDDGLQHYRMARDLEICVVDGARGFGNGWRLPAGPLRELPARVRRCALKLVNGGSSADNHGVSGIGFELVMSAQAKAVGSEETRSLGAFKLDALHAVAGIGHPQRFFDALRAQGLVPVTRAFPDHHKYRVRDFAFAKGGPVLMTEKDAVKCARLGVGNLWFVEVSAQFDAAARKRVVACLEDMFLKAAAS